MEGLNQVKENCSVTRDDSICDNQTLCRGFILQPQQILQTPPGAWDQHLSLCEIRTDPAVPLHQSPLQHILHLPFKDTDFLWLVFHTSEPFLRVFWVPPCTPPGCVWGRAPRGRPSLCSLCVGKHKLCSQGLCAAERHQVCYYNSSAFSGLYFLGYFIFSDLVSHLYNIRSNKGLPIQEDWVFQRNICSTKNIH